MPTQPLHCGHQTKTAGCRWCDLAADPRYRGLFAPQGRAGAGTEAAGTCSHLRSVTPWTVPCVGCRGRVALKIFGCDLHAQCTLAKEAPGLKCCAKCPDNDAARPRAGATEPVRLAASHRFVKRDLLYHVYPAEHHGGVIWRKCLGMLLRRVHLFNGKRVLAIVTGGGLEPAWRVKQMIEGHGFDVIETPNNPNLREAKTLPMLLERVRTAEPDRALFFGHAKGVTREPVLGNSTHSWSNLCHEASLDYWPLVETLLQGRPLAGPFLKPGYGFAKSRSSWHYSGTFFWARSADLFARDWKVIDQKWFGAESYLGLHYGPGEAAAIFPADGRPRLNLYDRDQMADVLNEYCWWRVANEVNRTENAPCPTAP